MGQLKHIDLITLGCAKNTVDSEHLLRQLQVVGYKVHYDGTLHGEIVLVNTCGFIADAQQESIDTILQLCLYKRQGRIKQIIVFGCLSQRFRNELRTELPEVDTFFGKFDSEHIVQYLTGHTTTCEPYERILTGTKNSTYIKISEGCNRTCSYCAIPQMVGNYHSRPLEQIIAEVRWLVQQGVKEFNIIAQDICYYGLDRYHTQRLPELIENIANIKGIEWIRLHYAYPTNFPIPLLDVMKKHDNICKYLDIPFQHCTDHILGLMRRGITAAEQDTLIETIRSEIPNICLRTTLLVGHPQETEDDQQALLQWIKKQQFQHLGVFTYSEEQGTYAQQHYVDDVPLTIKEARKKELMDVQEGISANYLQTFLQKTIKVFVERKENNYYLCRTQFDSPEVDCEVQVTGQRLTVGDFADVRIEKNNCFTLFGTTITR